MDYENLPGTGRDAMGGEPADQAQMVPELAAAAAAAARRGGVPLLPDANGVVVLPAGATIDDLKVVGRDLVLTLSDGEVFVIPDGAVYVPQIVVDGVAVPPMNLAALLIGEQPIEPAAGPARSSGGNFFEPAGPIQPGFNIGDLLPPTEFNRPLEENREVIPQPIDRDPTLVIVTPNTGPVGASDATANVAEAGLPARNGEPAGSNAAANSETTSGTILFNSPDGIAALTINGTAISAPGQTVVSPRGTLTITNVDLVNGTIGFTYTLTDNLVGGTVADQFTVALTDPDGDIATSTLTVNVADDVPTARNDTDALAARVFTAETGNVITGTGTTSGAAGADTLGADGASLTRIASNAVAANVDTSFDAAGNLQVAGQYGTLLIKADGSYSYTRNPGTPGGVNDAFTYTLTDGDGSTSTATLTIAIADAAPVITSVPTTGPSTVVAESGLPVRTGEAPGSNAPAPTETTTGTITFTGGDAPVTVTINGTPIAVGTVITTPSGTLTVTSFDPNAGTIGYNFTLTDNTAGDTTSVTFNLVVTDVDGDSAPGAFTITIVDDVPDAINDVATQPSENAAVTVNVLANDIQGADSVAFSAVAAVPGTLSGAGTLTYNNNGTFTYTPAAGEQGTVTFDYTITDGDGDSDRATVTITLLADSTPTVAVAGDNTVDEAALGARQGEPAGSNAASTDETAAGTIAVTTGGDTLASLVINGVNVTAGGTVTTAKGVLTVTLANGAYGYSYTLTDNTLADPDSDTFAVTVTDSDGDAATTSLVVAIADDRPSANDDAGSVAAGTYGPISGSVTANDVPGADGIVVLSYSGATVGSAGTTVQGQYGTLSIAANGTYSYIRSAGTPGGVSDSFTYTVRDGDGDTASAKLVIAIANSGTTLTLPISGTPGATQVLEAGLPAGSAGATNGEFASGTFSFTAPDGPATVTIGGTVITTVGQTVSGSFGTLTITSVSAGQISYIYQLTTNTNGDTTSDSFAVKVADQDGDSTSGTLTIAIVDDIPTARDDGPFSPAEDTAIVINALGNDTRGADGVVNATGVAIATGPAKGTVVYNGDGTFTYTPTAGKEGSDSFTYTITDGDGDTSTATVTITLATDSTPTIAVAGDNTVDEAALGTRPGEPAGSNAASADETASGTIAITTGNDAIAKLVINGTDVTGGGVVTTAKGALTVTLSGGAYSYSYTLADNTLADPDSDSFALTVTDSDGDTASTALVIAIADDAPTAADDANTLAAGTYGPIGGNVRTNDTQGADGAVVVSYSGQTSGAAGTTIDGQYGKLTIAADGTYSYSRNSGTPGGVSDSFTYTIQDGDGDQSSAKLVIAITNSGTTLTLPIDGTPGVTQVLEAGLGTATNTGSAAATDGEFAKGTFSFTAPDGPAVVTIGTTTVTTVGQTITGSFGTLTITSIAPGQIGYTYQLTTNTGGDTTKDAFAVTVADQDGDSTSGTLTITIVDDVPTARDDGSFDVAEQTALTINVFVNDTAGADGVVLNGAVALTTGPTKGTVVYNGDGTFTYTPTPGAQGADSFTYTITDGDSDSSTATVTLNLLADSVPVVKSVTALSVDEDGLAGHNVDGSTVVHPAEVAGSGSSSDASGKAVVTFGADVPAGVLLDSIVFTNAAGLNGQLVSAAGNAVTFTLSADGHTLIGTAGGSEAIRITLTGASVTDAATGEVTYTYSTLLSQAVQQAGGNGENSIDLTGVSFRVTDFDTDTASGSFKVTITDDVPGLNVTQGTEAGITLTTQDAQTAGTLTDSDVTTAAFGGVFGLTSTAGADGASTPALNYALGLTSSVSGLTSHGVAINLYQLADGTIVGSTATTQPGAIDASAVFSLSVSSGGVVTLSQYSQIDHPIAGDPSATAAPFEDHLASLADGLVTLTASATITDRDGDTASDSETVNIGANIRFADDGPSLTGVTAGASVTLDETDAGEAFAKTISATSTTAAITATTAFGADGPLGNTAAAGTTYGLAIVGDGTTALKTAIGDETITLVQTSATTITGQYGANQTAFTLTIGTDGKVTVVQNVALEHNVDGAAAPGLNDPHNDALDLSGLVNATITLTDFDGDTANGSAAIGGNIVFRDDGPTLDVTAGTDAGVILTTRDAFTDGTPTPSDAASSTAKFGNVFALAFTQGADGAATPSLGYTLGVTTSASGLSSQGSAITLAKLADGTVVGYTGMTVPTTETAASVVFSVKVASDGTVTLTQFQQVDHAPEAAPAPGTDAPFDDQFAVLADGKLTLTASSSITDNDGDTASDNVTIDLGGNLRFADDGPTASAVSVTQGFENASFPIAITNAFTTGADGLGSITFTQPSQGTVTLTGTTFTYTPASGAGSSGTADSFSYTITDFDGDTAMATVSITLQPDSLPMIKSTINLNVDEDGLAGHNVDGSTVVHPAEVAGSGSSSDASGKAVVTFGADVPAGVLLNSIVFTNAAGLNGQLVSAAGNAVTFTLSADGHTLIGTAGGSEAIRITLTGASVTDAATGEVTYTYSTLLSQAVQQAGGNGENSIDLTGVSFRVTDFDTDTASGSFKVTITDDVPGLNVTQGTEAGVTLTTQDAQTAGTLTDSDVTTAAFGGVFGLTSTAGADGASTPALSYALGLTSSVSGLTSHGVAINLYQLADGTIVGSTATTPPGAIDASAVFSLSVSSGGVVTLSQYSQIDHPIAGDPSATAAPFEDHLASLADGLVTLTASATITDRDGDTATDSETVNIGANIRFADDGPSLTGVTAGASVTLDETLAGNNFVTAISSSSSGSVIAFTPAFGADGAAATGATTYGLSITSATSSLMTAVGNYAITLVQNGANSVKGQYNDGTVHDAFVVTINSDGSLTVQQLVALEHLDPTNPDDSLFLTANGLANGASLIDATVTIKDFDGDTANASQAIGSSVQFKDDGPSIDVTKVSDTGVVLTTHDALTAGAASDSASSTIKFGNVFGLTSAPGADGASTPSLSYALSIASGGASSGLSSHGSAITLVQIGTAIVGYTGSTMPTAESDSQVVFSVKVASDGTVTLTQYSQVDHPTATDPSATAAPFDDDFATLAAGHILLTASATITDNDGDTRSDSEVVDLGGNIRFADDGPTASIVTAAGQTDDEGKAPFAALSNEGVPVATAGTDVAGSPSQLSGAAGSLFASGADGLASVTVSGPAGLMAIYDAGNDGDAEKEAVSYSSVAGSDGSVTYTATGAVSGQLVFTLQVNADGSYLFTQNRAVVHAGAGEDDLAIKFDFTVKDFDGDTAAGSLTVTVDDDTPIGNVVVATPTDDEGAAGPFTGLEGGTGDITGTPSTASGAAGALFRAGADGLGSVVLTTMPTLKAIYAGTASGNTGSALQENVTITTSTAANGTLTVTGKGATSGATVFTLVVGNDGSYTFTQSRPLVHSGAGEDNLPLRFGFTVTDGDSDTATASLSISVNDDTPTNFTPQAYSIINTGNQTAITKSLDTAGNGIFDNAGADGIKSLTFAAAIDGTKLMGASGTLQSGGQDIYLYIQANGSLIASTDSNRTDGIAAGSTVFTASLDAATGQYTIDFDRTIDNGSGTKIADFSATKAGQNQWNGVDPDLVNGVAIDIAAANDPNPDSTDLLFTPSAGGTINTSATDIGVSNQFVDSNETVRIDLVQDLRRDAGVDEATAGGYLYDTHVGVTQATFQILQIQGGGTSSVRISATNVDDTNALSQSNVGAVAINTAVDLDHSTVIVKNSAGVVQTDVTIYDAGNDIVISGLEAGDTVSFGAQNNVTFESFTIDNAAGDAKPVGGGTLAGKAFAVGGFAYSFVAIGSPVAFTLPVVLTDGDGDTSTGSIAVTVNPVTPVALDLDGDGVEFTGLSAGTTFDYNNDGSLAHTAWVGKDDGLLAFDGNGNGRVDGGNEIVFGGNGLTDLQGLAANHDSNHDGTLDAQDADFAKFGVWQDANGNGVSDAGEFHTLSELGIASVGLVSDGKAYTAAGGEVSVAGSASFTRIDGSTGTVADAAFATAPLERKADELAAVAATTAGIVAAAAATVAALPAAAADSAPAAVQSDAPPVQSLQSLPETHTALRPASDAPSAHEPAKAAPETHSAHAEDAPSHLATLADAADHSASAPIALEHAGPEFVQAAAHFAGGDAGQLMDALLMATQASGAASVAKALPVDLAAVHDAFGDTHGAALVDAIAAHFAGDAPAHPLPAGDGALAALFASQVGGAEAFAAMFDMNAMIHDQVATAAATA